MSDPTNPFAALSLIVAPAVLTNASSILVLSTSNRLARAIDRARHLATQLESPRDIPGRFTTLRLKEMDSSERRALMLLVLCDSSTHPWGHLPVPPSLRSWGGPYRRSGSEPCRPLWSW